MYRYVSYENYAGTRPSAEAPNKCSLRDGTRTTSGADGSVFQLQDAETQHREGSTCIIIVLAGVSSKIILWSPVAHEGARHNIISQANQLREGDCVSSSSNNCVSSSSNDSRTTQQLHFVAPAEKQQ